jgi:aromatic-L-amino-acid decarboxylase
MDCSILYTRRPDVLRAAFSLVPPDYLAPRETARNLMDYGVSLGRRFRALKVWFVLRAYGAEGIRAILREHIRIARLFADWIDADANFERLAPTRFSVVVFRHVPAGLRGDEAALTEHNQTLLERINRSGAIFLSQTRAQGRTALRLAIGNAATGEAHIRRAWDLLQQEARAGSAQRA